MTSVSEMRRGHNGRLEASFAAAKEKGEAAFITFITAGYPRKEGMYILEVFVSLLNKLQSHMLRFLFVLDAQNITSLTLQKCYIVAISITYYLVTSQLVQIHRRFS